MSARELIQIDDERFWQNESPLLELSLGLVLVRMLWLPFIITIIITEHNRSHRRVTAWWSVLVETLVLVHQRASLRYHYAAESRLATFRISSTRTCERAYYEATDVSVRVVTMNRDIVASPRYPQRPFSARHDLRAASAAASVVPERAAR